VQLAVVAMLCQGHVLIEDVPGVGKTVLANSLAKSIGCSFRRIQFTPDMLPSDVTGVNVYDEQAGQFAFIPGPIFANVILADEINRGTPRVQSSLLECMSESMVTVDGRSYALRKPFFVIATQNPVEFHGTFPLPEAQLDRFLMRISLGYPRPEEEISILDAQQFQHPLETIEQVIDAQELKEAQEEVKRVYVDPLIKEYIVSLVNATREYPDVYLGASPRGSLGLFKTCQALAALQGRDFVIPDDAKALAESVLAHRIIVSPSARIKNVDTRAVVQEILSTLPVPGTRVRSGAR